ncbi:hypothetical protein [Caulobacter henricii]|uniref:Mom family adenine methylcarbamoylation protein n=1 Tax=Caulobacter henricii TaxID=69395 RepID=UPI0014133BF5|nr:hypothetical protein [Caulobacter henricii]
MTSILNSTACGWMTTRRAAPRLSESRAIAYAVRYVRRAWPSVKWLQTFADERCGQNGAVFQACNFVFVGEHLSTFLGVRRCAFPQCGHDGQGPGKGQAWRLASRQCRSRDPA